MTHAQQQEAAKQFVERWQGKGYEKGQTQPFWNDLICNVFGVADFSTFLEFENQIKDTAGAKTTTNFIDVYIPSTKVMIEQKGSHKDLRKPIKQSDGSMLTPFQQAQKYTRYLPLSQQPRWIIACNFDEFLIYDMEQPNQEPEQIFLKDLEKEFYRLSFIVSNSSVHIKKELEVSKKAGDIIGEIYDAILKQYKDAANPSHETLRSLNMLCVRIVFCLYAEDAGIFGSKSMFGDYLKKFEPQYLRNALLELFKILDQDSHQRDEYLNDDLAQFPYVNGGLFTQVDTTIPHLTAEIKELLIAHASSEFDWSDISPTIFGAIFESTLNPQTRRSGGMHYTSIENIHKVIDPLFLNDLWSEFNTIIQSKQVNIRNQKLLEFQQKLGSLKFLDPACGSGNFLTEAYLSLRRLENECLRLRFSDGILDLRDDTIFVHIHQFYGIEINDFASVVAKTALWIAESQMMAQTSKIIHRNLDFLPLKSYTNVIEANALRLDWNELIPKEELNYIMGNPPFVGARLMNEAQKADLLSTWGKAKNAGNLDYVSCWYKKSADMIKDSNIKAALVSTNSITQGEQVAIMWKPLIENGININFAYHTFRWDSEATAKAAVHCVIIGFSYQKQSENLLFLNETQVSKCKNINGYLVDAENVFIESRTKPLCDVSPLLTGSQRIDDDNFMFDEETKKEFLKKEPLAEKYFKIWYGADEFLNNRPRWCLYLGKCSPAELKKMPYCMKIIENVRNYRLASKRSATIKAADYPSRFGLEVIPDSNFMIVPVVSSEKRRYIPLGFMTPENLCSNQVNLIPNATLYEFGILTSSVHMAWVRAVCGRLEMRYRYSKDIVYNNFPWCEPTQAQKAKIEQTAQEILNARALYPDSSLADLYDETLMPVELRKAHDQNDKAVLAAYGFSSKISEPQIVAELFKLYQSLTQKS